MKEHLMFDIACD